MSPLYIFHTTTKLSVLFQFYFYLLYSIRQSLCLYILFLLLLLLLGFFFFFEIEFLCLARPRTFSVDQASLKYKNPPASDSQVLLG